MFLIDFPDFLETSDFYASTNSDDDKTCQHNHRLKHVCPYHSLKTTLESKHMHLSVNWYCCNLVSQNDDGPGSINYSIAVMSQLWDSHAANAYSKTL